MRRRTGQGSTAGAGRAGLAAVLLALPVAAQDGVSAGPSDQGIGVITAQYLIITGKYMHAGLF